MAAEDTVKSHTGLIAVLVFVGGLLWIWWSQRTPTKKPAIADVGNSLAAQTPTSFVSPNLAAPSLSFNLGGPSDEAFTLPTIAPRTPSQQNTTPTNSGACSGCSGCGGKDSCEESTRVVSSSTFFQSLTPTYVSQQVALIEQLNSPTLSVVPNNVQSWGYNTPVIGLGKGH